jgi:IclR family transcriptional regulator, KDG regulon repressor
LPARGKESYSIHSVENALNVLEALCDEPDDIQISRLSEKLGMNKTSVFRVLATFENRGYVEREEASGRYHLGLAAYEIGQKLLSRMDVLNKARPQMQKLVRDCNETVYLALRRGHEVLLLDLADTTQQVKIISLAGQRFPLANTAAGRVILAHLPEAEECGSQLDQEQRNVTRRQGYAIDTDALGEGISSIAAPLFSGHGVLAGCLCCVGPTFRLSQQAITDCLLPSLKEACMIISSKLGYLGPHLRR